MIGLVLCGGQSVRMGADKGSIPIDNQNWASLAQEKLKSLNIPVKFSVNADQEIAYTKWFLKENLIHDSQNLHIGGPLKGILSGHLLAPEEDLFVLACDLIKMDVDLMKNLINIQEKQSEFEAYVYTNPDFYEPLCGIYTASGLAKIVKLYQKEELKKHSLQYVLGELNTYKIALSATEQSYFKNFNSPADLNEL